MTRLTNRARRLRDRRRARFALSVLLGLAVAGVGWQLVLAGLTVDLLVHWWPAPAAAVALTMVGTSFFLADMTAGFVWANDADFTGAWW